MFFPKKAVWIILISILFLAFAVRIFGSVKVLQSLNWDEVSHAYNAYSLLKTGRDQWNQPFPFLNFRAYGDFPTTLNLYLTVPFISLFGQNDMAVRFPHILAGVLTVLIAFVCGSRWQKNLFFGLITAFLTAFEPWTLFPSLAIFQSNIAVLLLFLGLALFYSEHKPAAFLVWGLSLFSYHNTRIFIPIFIMSLLFIPSKSAQKKYSLLLISLILFSGSILWFSESRARSNWVGILDQGAIAYIESKRNLSALPPQISRILFNRPVFMLTNITANYLQYFSPKYLFLSGGTQYQYSIPGFGVLNLALLPFFYYGIYLIFKQKKYILITWLLLSPIPAAITRDHYAVIRSTTMIPAVMLISALGIFSLFKLKTKTSLFIIPAFILSFLYFMTTYQYNLFSNYFLRYASSWQYGNKQMVALVKSKFPQFDQIFITKKYGEPHEYLFWYWPWEPKTVQTDPTLKTDYHANWYWVDAIDKIKFINDWEMQNLAKMLPPGDRYLFVSAADSAPDGAVLDKIIFPDGSPAYIFTAL